MNYKKFLIIWFLFCTLNMVIYFIINWSIKNFKNLSVFLRKSFYSELSIRQIMPIKEWSDKSLYGEAHGQIIISHQEYKAFSTSWIFANIANNI